MLRTYIFRQSSHLMLAKKELAGLGCEIHEDSIGTDVFEITLKFDPMFIPEAEIEDMVAGYGGVGSVENGA